MLNPYKKFIVPRLLNFKMGSANLEGVRRTVVAGSGYNLPLYRNISKLYALEPSKELIAIARTRAGSSLFPIEFLNTEAEHIPLPDCSVDTVVSTWTLCSVTDPQKVLDEVLRVLRPQGNFIFAEHGASPHAGLRTLQTALTSVTKYLTGNCHYDRPFERLLKEAGFYIKKIEHPRERFKPLIYNYQGTAVPKKLSEK